MFNNNFHTDNTDQTEATESFLARNGRRIAAVAFIALAGSAGVSGIASANEAPSHDGKAPTQHETLESDYDEPQWSVPETVNELPKPGYKDPVDPEYGGPYTIDTVPDAEYPKDPKDPKDPGDEVPGDETTTTTTTEPEYPEYPEEDYPEYPEEEYPEPEVQEKTTERTGGDELAYTGNDSKLPLVGAGLVLTGGLAAGGSVLSRRLKGANS